MKARYIIFYIEYHKYYTGDSSTPQYGERIVKKEEVDYEVDDISKLTIPSKDVNMVMVDTILEEEVEYKGQKYTLANCFGSLTKTWHIGKFMSPEDVEKNFGGDRNEYWRLHAGGSDGCCVFDNNSLRKPLRFKNNDIVVDSSTLNYASEPGDE